MDNVFKILLTVGAVLIVVGLILFTVVMSLNRWDFRKLGTMTLVTNEHAVTENFSDILVETDTADIRFVRSDSRECKVVCYEPDKAGHRVSVEDGCLTVRLVDERAWYDHIGIHIGTPKLTVFLPESAYGQLRVLGSTGDTELPKDLSFEHIDITASTGDVKCFASAAEQLKIRLSTGDVRLEDLSAGSLDVTVSTGHITASQIRCNGDTSIQVTTGKAFLRDMTCNALTSTGNTGDLVLENVTAAQSFSIIRSTGDVTFKGCDAGELSVKTDTGDISGSLRSDKLFIAQTGTGHIHVPKTVTGGRCEMTTSTGDIEITVAPSEGR